MLRINGLSFDALVSRSLKPSIIQRITQIARAMSGVSKNLADARINYAKGVLMEDSIPADPIILFNKWFEDHQVTCKDIYVEPNAVILSTCDPATLRPAARVVLMKSYSNDGFVFFTNYESRKGLEIAANPVGAMTFYWYYCAYAGMSVKFALKDRS
jgi:pyridoxine/pyridoxamine 5'-phosphate oxidase